MPSRYILIVLVLDLRLVKDGNGLVTRPLVTVTDEAVIRHTAAVERFILDSVSFYYLCLFNERVCTLRQLINERDEWIDGDD
jgi:hypothetical protein